MNKILVEIYVPSLLKTYEVYLPLRSKMYEVLALLENAISELSEGFFQPNAGVIICERDTGIIYNINLTVEEVGLKNGSRLMIL